MVFYHQPYYMLTIYHIPYIHIIYIYIIYIYIIYIYIITGNEMKLDLGTQSFMQNTFSIFSLTIFNVLTLKITVQRYLYFYVTSGFWIFDPTVRNIYLFWWRHFDITSDFLFNKLFSLSSNISSFSFKQREHLFDWGLYALNWFYYSCYFWVGASCF